MTLGQVGTRVSGFSQQGLFPSAKSAQAKERTKRGIWLSVQHIWMSCSLLLRAAGCLRAPGAATVVRGTFRQAPLVPAPAPAPQTSCAGAAAHAAECTCPYFHLQLHGRTSPAPGISAPARHTASKRPSLSSATAPSKLCRVLGTTPRQICECALLGHIQTTQTARRYESKTHVQTQYDQQLAKKHLKYKVQLPSLAQIIPQPVLHCLPGFVE